jgi:hypothetical protein
MVHATSSDEVAMTSKSARKPDDPAQSKRFIEAARKAEANETREGADRAFKKAVLPQKVRKTAGKVNPART